MNNTHDKLGNTWERKGDMQWGNDFSLLPEGDRLTSTSNLDNIPDFAAALLTHYSFDLSGYNARELVKIWQKQYPVSWLNLAVIEALYQGRYKAVSVQQILTFWQRRGMAVYHFNMEFERLICSRFPENLTSISPPSLPPIPKTTSQEKVTKSTNLLPSASSNGYRHTPHPHELPTREHGKSKNEEKVDTRRNENSSEKTTSPIVPFSASNFATSSRLPAWAASSASRPRKQEDSKPPQLNPQSHQLANPQDKHTQETSNPELSPVSNKRETLPPPTANYPPIGQFTPEKSDRSESFTSKLKAISKVNSQ